ncbi:MAG: hypothetical protein JXR70_13235 [Spirochaetales bacterium]|nr:hypothetical protein [Spirochaetales bacterium]
MRYIFSLIFAAFIFAGCATLAENVIQSTVDTRDFKEIEQIDLLLLEYQQKNNPSFLLEAEERALKMAKDEVLNKEYKASVYGLLGEIENLKGNKQGVRAALEQIRLLSAREESAYILASFLENNPENQIKQLEAGLASSSSTAKISFFLARLYFTKGEFEKAAAFFDEAFSLLPLQYTEYFKAERDLAYQFIYNPPKNLEAADLLSKSELTVSDMVMLTLLQTDFLDNISVNKKTAPEKLFQDLMKGGYFHDTGLVLDRLCQRKNVAYFLLRIVAYLENDTNILTKYSEQFLKNNLESPVPDVLPSHYYFNAVLILVEREIMEVPDGIHFFPDKTLSGVEFSEMLDRIGQRYF